ncbi:MAG: TIGR00341 family protein [Candidatus Gracilibacteria bacterium]|nr:TIGR00341 family protein [Candidatus Gracilibacteria bacterium]
MLERFKDISKDIKKGVINEKKVEKKTKLEKKIEEVKKKGIETIINEKEKTWVDKINSWFNMIEFLELTQEEKTEVAIKVKEQAKADRLYRMEIFLSGTIASLGLLLNSVAVIIGAMLIAPFLRPINGIAFGIARGEKKFFINSIKILIISSLISIFTGFMIMNITGLYKETTEMLARTSPNIIDLFVAIFSAMVALLSLRYKRLGESVAGVAMAAALMPPLGVIGMELALGNYGLAWGATMLFITNIFAIILVGILAFWLYGFTPNDGGKQKKAFVRILLVIFLILIISIPLFQNLSYLKDRAFVEQKINNNLYLILNKKIDHFSVSNISIKELTKNDIKIKAEVKILEGIKFYDFYSDFLNKKLSEAIGRKVEVEIELTIVANIVSKSEEEKSILKNNEIQKKLKELDKQKQEEYIKYIQDIKNNFEKEISIKLQKEIEEKMKKEFNILLEEKLLELKSAVKIDTGSGKVLEEKK